MDRKARAQELRDIQERHYNCCQAVLIPFAEELGIDHETAYRLAAHFGGGMRRQATCGAVTGALMALGLLGRGEEPIAVDFQERFRREAGALDCGDLVQAALDRGEEKKPSCDRLIALAVDMVEDFAREA